MNEKLLFLKFLATLINYCDYLTTVIGIHKYECKEINPIGRWLLKRPILLILIKIVLVSFIIGFFMNNEKNLMVFIIILGLISLNNFIVILKKRRRMKKNGKI